jgi:protein-S-isoprenylcysteine O-methyltransferase Ste14
MKKRLYFLYAILCYGIFFITFLYLIGFVTGLVVQKTIDTGAIVPVWMAVLTDLGLISLFGLQHSVMARQGFKNSWTKIIPAPIERSTYVLFASMAVIILLVFWQPIPVILWDFSNTTGGNIVEITGFMGWGIVLLSTFLINHFHLFGLYQVYQYAADLKTNSIPFKTPFLYRLVRHPLYLGFLIAFWVTPVMSVGHLLFSLCMTIYIFIGIYHEEKDLEKLYGHTYVQYKQKTPKILPLSK